MALPAPMMADNDSPAGFSLRRWSQRKLAAARAAPDAAPAPAAPPTAGATLASEAPIRATPAKTAPVDTPSPAALPPVESLDHDSDFTAFMQPEVDELVKRQALRKLFRDPRFNVMDGLDIYVGDYSLPDPISPEAVRGLMQARAIFDPPQTRINAQGFVEDVPVEERAPAPGAAHGEASAGVPAEQAPAVAAGQRAVSGHAGDSPPADPAADMRTTDPAITDSPDAAGSGDDRRSRK